MNTELPPNYKGTLFVDTLTLLDMSAAVVPQLTERLTKDPIRHYFDILPFLGKQGYEIVIPELAALRIGHFVVASQPDGKPKILDVNRYFPHAAREDDFPYRPELTKFLHEVAAGKHPNIRIEPSQNAEINDNINALRQTMLAYPTPNREARANLIGIQNRIKLVTTEHMLSQALTLNTPERQLFIFTDHFSAMRDMRNYCNDSVNFLNLKAVIDSLCQHRLHEALGFQPDINPDLIKTSIDEQCMNQTGKNRKTLVSIDHSAGALPRDPWTASNGDCDHPFSKTLRGLSKILEAGKMPEEQVLRDNPTSPPAPQVSRMEKFAQKWGADWRAKTGLPSERDSSNKR